MHVIYNSREASPLQWLDRYAASSFRAVTKLWHLWLSVEAWSILPGHLVRQQHDRRPMSVSARPPRIHFRPEGYRLFKNLAARQKYETCSGPSTGDEQTARVAEGDSADRDVPRNQGRKRGLLYSMYRNHHLDDVAHGHCSCQSDELKRISCTTAADGLRRSTCLGSRVNND